MRTYINNFGGII